MSVIDLAPTILDITNIPIPTQMQGKSIFDVLKNPQIPGRRYIYSERNWHNCDEHIRSIRSSRFKLITNAYTDLPHGSPSDITKSPSWQSLYNLKSENQLNKAQSLLFTVPRPKEELYDIINDPNELNNIVNDPDYQDVLKELRHELAKWKEKTGDFPPEERRRKDNTDRITGIKYDQTRLPDAK
jgi:arylsulfatase A-like enzyme